MCCEKDPLTYMSIEKSICYTKYPTRILGVENRITDNDWKKDPRQYSCPSTRIGIRSLLESQLMSYGMSRVVLGGNKSREILSQERHFQMKHASTRTIHSPGHVAGAYLSVNSDQISNLVDCRQGFFMGPTILLVLSNYPPTKEFQ